MNNKSTKTTDATETKVSFDKKSLITFDETKDLIGDLLMEAEYHPYALYGFMFMFHSFMEAVHNGEKIHVSNICEEMLRELYAHTWNASEGEDYLRKNIASAYRKADFTKDQPTAAQFFLDAETEARREASQTAEPLEDSDSQRQPPSDEETKKEVLDLSAMCGEFLRTNEATAGEKPIPLAVLLSAAMKHPDMPKGIYEVLGDQLCEIPDDISERPEIIQLTLDKMREKESKGE